MEKSEETSRKRKLKEPEGGGGDDGDGTSSAPPPKKQQRAGGDGDSRDKEEANEEPRKEVAEDDPGEEKSNHKASEAQGGETTPQGVTNAGTSFATGGAAAAPATKDEISEDAAPSSSREKKADENSEEDRMGVEDQDHTATEKGSAKEREEGGKPTEGAKLERDNTYDKLRWIVVKNNGRPESLIKLVALKSLFSKQLPKMPRAYIARLVFDRRHTAIAILSDDPAVKDTDEEVIGSICYRAFPEMRFAEIAFCAVNAAHQVKVRSFLPRSVAAVSSSEGMRTKRRNARNLPPREHPFFLSFRDMCV